MLPKKYHAILFICILVMLLLLGLHLLGIGYGSGQVAAKTAALARNSSQTTSSSTNVNTLSQSQAYRHPIVYDKLTGATNNQINEVLGAAKSVSNDYPIDHYQQQQQQSNQQQQHQFNQLPQDDFFNSIHRQGGPGFPPIQHPAHHMHLPMGPPGMQIPPPMMTTQTPTLRPQQPLPPPPRQLHLGPPLPPMAPPPPPPIERRPAASETTPTGSSFVQADSLPSASSLNNDGSRQPSLSAALNGTNQKLTNNLQQQQRQPIYPQQLQQQQHQLAYYTPPIFAYNNFDQNKAPMLDPQLALPFGFPQQQPQQPPLGVPEAPLSIDEYNARQARLRPQNQMQQQQQQQPNEVAQIDRYGKPSRANVASKEPQFSGGQANLLADPQQQQLHKQQMLDRNQLLFGPYTPDNNNQSYYPDPALAGYRPLVGSPPPPNSIRPPYAQNMSPTPPTAELVEQFGNNNNRGPAAPISAAQNRATNLVNNNRLDPEQAKLVATERPPKMLTPSPAPAQQLQQAGGQSAIVPICARQQQQVTLNETLNNSTLQQLPVLFCNEDLEYPTKEIMRALENYASERSIEQLFPQPLVQIHLSQRNNPDNSSPGGRQLALDSLQPSIGGPLMVVAPGKDQLATQLFPSTNYESMCRSNIYMGQPRRAKNLLGQWKIIVNLPGHKYRGIAISQMLRLEECSRPNSECIGPNLREPPGLAGARALGTAPPTQVSGGGPLPRSRCLQQYENQRLVAWSHQQGLHVDIFRVPIACSCHIRR